MKNAPPAGEPVPAPKKKKKVVAKKPAAKKKPVGGIGGLTGAVATPKFEKMKKGRNYGE